MLKSILLHRQAIKTPMKNGVNSLIGTTFNGDIINVGPPFVKQSCLNGTIRYASSPAAAYNQSIDTFPSIIIGADGLISPRGPFAEAQAQVR